MIFFNLSLFFLYISFFLFFFVSLLSKGMSGWDNFENEEKIIVENMRKNEWEGREVEKWSGSVTFSQNPPKLDLPKLRRKWKWKWETMILTKFSFATNKQSFFFFFWVLILLFVFLLISFVFICFFHSHFFPLFSLFLKKIYFVSFWLVIKKSEVFIHIFF